MALRTTWFLLLMIPLVGADMMTLSMAAFGSPGFLSQKWHPDGSVELIGPGKEFIDWISRYGKFKYELTRSGEVKRRLATIVPKKPNSTEPDYGAAKVDFVLAPIGIYSGYFTTGDTTVLTRASIYMLTQYPQEDTKLWVFVTPFTATVWACIGGAAVIVGGVLHAMNRICSPRHSFSGPYMYLLQIVLAQGGSVSTRKFCFLLVATAWCVGALILSNVYLSLVVTAFAAPLRRPIAQTLEEFHDKNLLPILVETSHAEFTFRESPPGSMMRTIYERSKAETNCNFTVQESCLEYLRQNPYSAMFVSESAIPSLALDDYTNSKKCRVTPFKLDVTVVLASWYLVRKNHPLAKAMKLATLRTIEYGLRNKFADYYRKVCYCCNWKNEPTRLSELKLSDVGSVFAILGVCYLVSFAVFIVEVVWGRRVKLRASRLTKAKN